MHFSATDFVLDRDWSQIFVKKIPVFPSHYLESLELTNSYQVVKNTFILNFYPSVLVNTPTCIRVARFELGVPIHI